MGWGGEVSFPLFCPRSPQSLCVQGFSSAQLWPSLREKSPLKIDVTGLPSPPPTSSLVM